MKIEINVKKKHIAVIVAAMLLISALSSISLVTAPDVPEFDGTQPFHEVLYTHIIKTMTPDIIVDASLLEVTGDLKVLGNVEILGNVKGTIPEGFCIFSATESECPEGWVEKAEFFDGGLSRTIRGVSVASGDVGGAGGADEHAHHVTMPGEGTQDGSGHHVAENGVAVLSTSASSWPPFINVLICCRESAATS